MTPADARRPVSVKPDLGCRVGAKVTPAAWFDGGGHQVLGAPPLEPVKSEHLREKAVLAESVVLSATERARNETR